MNKHLRVVFKQLDLDKDLRDDLQLYHVDMVALKANNAANKALEIEAKEVDLYEEYEKLFQTRRTRK